MIVTLPGIEHDHDPGFNLPLLTKNFDAYNKAEFPVDIITVSCGRAKIFLQTLDTLNYFPYYEPIPEDDPEKNK